MGLREKFLASGKELERVELTITLGGVEQKVYASDLSGRQRIEFEKFMHGQLDDSGRLASSTAVAAKLVQLGLVDEDGALVFDKRDDHAAICELSSQMIVSLARAIGIVSGIYSAEQDHESDGSNEGEPAESLDEDPHLAGLSPKNELSEQGSCL
jgi:hypothetical protein